MGLDNRNRLLVVSAMPPVDKPTLGGNHRYLRDLLSVLATVGFELHLISDEHQAYEALLETVSALGVVRHKAPFCTDAATASAALDHALRELSPRLVHVNGHQGWLAPALLGSHQFRDHPHKVFTMHLPVAALEILDKGSLKRLLPGSWSWKVIRSDRAFVQLFDKVISVSERFGRGLAEHGLLSAEQVHWIPNAVDSHRFAPRAKPSRQEYVIGGAGNLTEQKRFDILIEAFAKVAGAHPNLQLRIAGEGPLRGPLEKLASKLNVGPQVAFLGFQEDMAAFYNSLDVFVLSSDAEAAPYVALEAAASGVPGVLTDVGDIRVWFRHGIEAMIAPTRDVRLLAEGIGKLIADPDAASRIGAKARAVVVERHSQEAWEAAVKDFFYAEITTAKPVSP